MGMVTSQQGWNYIISTIYIDDIYPIFATKISYPMYIRYFAHVNI